MKILELELFKSTQCLNDKYLIHKYCNPGIFAAALFCGFTQISSKTL